MPERIVIAGGGFAALETLLALRALVGERLQITVVSPTPRFSYRPAATAEVYGEERSRAYDLRAICAELDAVYCRDRLEAIAPTQGRARLATFATLDYDALVLALGARSTVAVPGALTFRDQRDVPQFRRVLEQMREGRITRIVFAVPSGCSWPLALYELALLTAAHAKEHGLDVEIAVVSPREAPLDSLGEPISALLGAVLAERGVRFHGRSVPDAVRRDGSLTLHFGGTIAADRVIAAPELRGPRLTGVPTDWWGFVPTDTHGRVEDSPNVYAAGDMTTFPFKHGGLAALQADAIAQTIAVAHGVRDPGMGARRIVRARLLGGREPLVLRAVLDEEGHPTTASIERPDIATIDAGETKVFGRYLTPYLEGVEPLSVA